MLELDTAQIALGLENPTPHGSPGLGPRQGNQLRSAELAGGIEPGPPRPPSLLLKGKVRHLSQVTADLRIPVPRQRRQQFVAEAIAGKSQIAIGGVLPPFQAARSEKCLNLRPRHSDQRPDEPIFGHRMYSREAGQPRSAQNAEQDGLRLIVARMPQRDSIRRAIFDQRLEKLQPRPARLLFQISGRLPQARFRAEKRQIKPGRQRGNESLISVRGFPAQLVIKMRDARQIRPDLAQHMQQADRIRPAGDRRHHPATIRQHVITRDASANGIEHGGSSKTFAFTLLQNAQMRDTSNPSFIVSLDVGSSSVRALLFDSSAHQVEGYGARLPVHIETTPDGGVEIDPLKLADLTIDCLDELHRQVHDAGLKIAGIGGSAFWHSFLGVDEDGRPTLPILHLLDTRSAAEVAHVPDAHSRTGCVPHSSYWPAKLLWLRKNRQSQFAATRRLLSFPEFLFEKLFGAARASTSMVSATGLWNQNANDYDDEMLAVTGVDRSMLASIAELDSPQTQPLPEFREMWPAYAGAPWFPALGDGACDSVGSGAVGKDRFALMVGTTGALRAILEIPHIEIAPGLWCYRVDRKRFVTGGALSNGGEVYAWMKRTLALPKDVEARLEAATPGAHGLTVLPFLSGERSPYWRSDLRAAITGLKLDSGPFEILQAALESVSLRFREIYSILAGHLGAPAEVVASGGALLNSPAWTQMMADALGRDVVVCTEPEASSRGAALWVMEQIGTIESISALPVSTGATFQARPQYAAAYDRMLADQQTLYARLYGPKSPQT